MTPCRCTRNHPPLTSPRRAYLRSPNAAEWTFTRVGPDFPALGSIARGLAVSAA